MSNTHAVQGIAAALPPTSATQCPICFDDPLENAMLLPACGHSFCADCVTDLIASTRSTFFGNSEPRCPICRAFHTPGSAIPNYGLREAAEASTSAYDAAVAADVDHDLAAGPAAAAPQNPSAASPEALAALGIPAGLSRLACDEASKVGLRLFLLDNSGSTSEMDGHVLYSDRGRPPRLVTCTRWREICSSAEAAAKLGAATGVPCEFHLLNPLRGHALESAVEGEDYIRTGGAATASSDQQRLLRWLAKVTPRGVTPLAQRLRTLTPRFEAFVRDEAASGRVAFLIILTDGAPTPIDSGQPTDAAASAALLGLKRLVYSYPVRLVVRLCTDEDSAVDFWNRADSEEELPLDVLDDIQGEASEVARAGNGWLAYTPALHTLRESGTTIGLLDLLDERRLRPGEAATLASLLLDGGVTLIPDWKTEKEAFAGAITMLSMEAGKGYDARLRREAPLVNAEKLITACRSANTGIPMTIFQMENVPYPVFIVCIAMVLALLYFDPNYTRRSFFY